VSTQIQTLVPIIESKINNEIIQTVNARELHSFLGVGTHFRDWIKDRIVKYNFVENVDYIKILTQNLDAESTAAPESTTYEVSKMGQGRIDYHVTLDMAKEISMVERNEKGKEARLYFIKCEKELIETYKKVRAMSLSEFAVYSANKLLEQEREIENIKINQNLLTSKVDSIEAEAKRLRSHSDYYTIVAFCNIVKFKVSLVISSQIGKEATKYCRSNNIRIDKTHDPRFGVVNVYPVDALVAVCKVLFPNHNFDVIYI